MKQELQNLEIFTKDFAKPLPPSTFEILNHEPDCGGGESLAKWLSSVLLTILTAFVFAWAITGCASNPHQDVIKAFSGVRDNCYLVAIELQRRMGEGWYVVTLEKDGMAHAVTCGDYCMDNGFISPMPFAESLLKEQGWTITDIEQFRYVEAY